MNAMTRISMATVIAGAFGSAWANPTVPTVVSGAALVSNPSASVMQVVNTPGTIINWQGFSIANGETTRFVQLNAASAILNRVAGASPSSILGRLESNGRVFLINPNGIVFGGGSVVDVAGLIASTRNISDANFLAGNFLFDGPGNGAITMQSGAQILTSTYGPGGQVWLIGKNVTQEAGSTITAPQGQVVLAAGSQLQVATNGLGQMSFAVTTDGTSTVDSLGTIAADRGAVGMFADFINHRGTVNAGNQGNVAMDAAKELRIQGTSQINAPDGNITLRGGSVLEVEYDSIIHADGANGRISFESNNLLVSPSGNTHAVGGQVAFNQYQPTQYTAGAAGQLWVTPAGYVDRDTLVYRRSDGNNVVRFNRYGSNAVPPYVAPFEVVLDSRTGAVISGPTTLAALSSAAAARSAAQQAFATADAAYTAAFQAGTFTLTIQANWDTAQAANAVADTVYKTAYWAASPPVYNSDQFAYFVNPNTGARLLPSTSIPTSDGGSLAWNNLTIRRDLLSSAGTVVRSNVVMTAYSVPMSDGTYVTRAGAGLDVFSLNGSALPSVIESVALSSSGSNKVLVPNQQGGLSVIRLEFASHIAWDLAKTVAAYTPTALATGAAGNAAAFATAPGVGTAPTTPAPAAAPPPVASGGPTGGATFDGVSGCNSATCATEVRVALSAANAMRAASNMRTTAGGAIDSAAASRAVDALIEADANQAAVDRLVIGDADRAAAAASGAAAEADQRAVDAMIAADADRAAIDRMITADADRAAIDQLIGDAAQRSEVAAAATSAAARARAAAAAAEARARAVGDARASGQGGLLILGDAEVGRVLDDRSMTPQQKVAALNRSQEMELADQRFGTAPDGDRNVDGSRSALVRDIEFKALWADMTPEERLITMQNYDRALRAGEDDANLLDSVPDSAGRR